MKQFFFIKKLSLVRCTGPSATVLILRRGKQDYEFKDSWATHESLSLNQTPAFSCRGKRNVYVPRYLEHSHLCPGKLMHKAYSVVTSALPPAWTLSPAAHWLAWDEASSVSPPDQSASTTTSWTPSSCQVLWGDVEMNNGVSVIGSSLVWREGGKQGTQFPHRTMS